MKKKKKEKLKELDTKSPTCYYFDDMIRIKDFDLDNILIDEKPYENILAHTF